MQSYVITAALMVAIGLLSACSTTGNKTPEASQSNLAALAPAKVQQVALGAQQSRSSTMASAAPRAESDAPAQRTVYFDLDSNSIKASEQSVVESNGHYLARRPALEVVIRGHTDERGSREYNLALGQRRAEAVKRAFSLLGVPDSQMEAVSFGEEQPAAVGHYEIAWVKNRRADIVYSAR